LRIHLILLLAVAPGCLAATADIARRFFPEELIEGRGGIVPVRERQTVSELADLDGSGKRLIVAGYCNGSAGGVRILSPKAGGSVIATAIPEAMVCRDVSLRILDLDGDRRPEIIAIASQQRGLPATWVFRWRGNALTLLGEHPDGSDATFTDATFVVLDEKGSIGIVDHRSSDRLFTITNGVLHKVAELAAAAIFVRQRAQPTDQHFDFAVTNTDVLRDVVVINGDVDGSARVSNATVSLNGVVLLRTSAFKQRVLTLTPPVGLSATNTITVKIDGRPGGQLTVLVRDR
jgi:hypothetical protein